MRNVVSVKITTHPTNKTIDGYCPICVLLIFKRKYAPVTLKIPPVQNKSDLIKNDHTGEAVICHSAKYYKDRTTINEYLNDVLRVARAAIKELIDKDISYLNVLDLANEVKQTIDKDL